MSVRYRALALSDLEEIFHYLEPRSTIGARRVLGAIYEAIAQIERYPRSGTETSISGIRVRIIGRYRYKVSMRWPKMVRSKSSTYDMPRAGNGPAPRADTRMVVAAQVLAKVRALPQVQQAKPLHF